MNNDDAISRKSVIDVLIRNRVHFCDMVRITSELKELPSVTPKLEECNDAISREFIEIVVSYPPADLCAYPEYKGKPYFSIKYQENGKDYVGFGTYKIEVLSEWIKEYFMSIIQSKPKTGRWIREKKHHKDDFQEFDYWVVRCSECGARKRIGWTNVRHCPMCGAKMELYKGG